MNLSYGPSQKLPDLESSIMQRPIVAIPDVITIAIGFHPSGNTTFDFATVCRHLDSMMVDGQRFFDEPPRWMFEIDDDAHHFSVLSQANAILQAIDFRRNYFSDQIADGRRSIIACGKPLSAPSDLDFRIIDWFIADEKSGQAVNFRFQIKDSEVLPQLGFIAQFKLCQSFPGHGNFAWMPESFDAAEFCRHVRLNYGPLDT